MFWCPDSKVAVVNKTQACRDSTNSHLSEVFNAWLCNAVFTMLVTDLTICLTGSYPL